MVIFQQMFVFFCIMILGYVASNRGRISAETNRQLSWLVVNVANPAMILSSGTDPSLNVRYQDILTAFAVAVLVFAFLIVCAYLIPLVLHLPREKWAVYRLMMVFSNVGFIGLPILSAAFGKTATLYGTLFVIVYNILIYTYGMALMEKQKNRNRVWEKIKQICNIGVVACVGALILVFSHVRLPQVAVVTLTMLSNLTAPLSMLVIGASIGQMKLKELFTDAKVLLFCALKLVAIPALAMLCIDRFVSLPLLRAACLVVLATPIGSMTVMLAQKYDNEPETASKAVAVSSMFSVATLSLLSLLFPM